MSGWKPSKPTALKDLPLTSSQQQSFNAGRMLLEAKAEVDVMALQTCLWKFSMACHRWLRRKVVEANQIANQTNQNVAMLMDRIQLLEQKLATRKRHQLARVKSTHTMLNNLMISQRLEFIIHASMFQFFLHMSCYLYGHLYIALCYFEL